VSDALRIGELAQAAGVTSDTIRYYDRLRLLPRPARSGAGYRIYAAADIERLQFIKQAQTLGLSLDEIQVLLPRSEAGLAECKRVRDLLSAKLGELDTRLIELRAFRRRLARYLRECEETLAGNRGERTLEIGRPSRGLLSLEEDRRNEGYDSRRCAWSEERRANPRSFALI
jgi:DNA-binding transcriptional MerR regulator